MSADAIEVSQAPRGKRPWDRIAGEGVEAFHAFVHYRDLGPAVRSIVRALKSHEDACTVGRKGGKSGGASSRWDIWSSKHRWVERARLYDDEMDELKQEAFQAEVISMSERHARVAQEHMELLAMPAIAAVAALRKNPEVIDQLAELASVDPTQFVKLLAFVEEATRVIPGVAKMEREARGLSSPHADKAQGADQPEVKVVVHYQRDWEG